jgi:hypothetical protein
VTIDGWDIANVGNSVVLLNIVPTDGSVAEGLPSGTYWEFSAGKLDAASADSAAVPVNDASLATFPVNPTISSVAHGSAGQGALSRSLTISGSGFAAGAVVQISGSGITVMRTRVKTPTALAVTYSVESSAVAGARDVTVTNPDTGAATCNGCFAVDAAPAISKVKPSKVARGSTNVALTISGAGFAKGIVVSVSGSGVTVVSVVRVSARRLTVTVSVANDATKGSRTLTLTNKDGGRASAALRVE